jgi:hypothetical protein
MHSFLIIFRRRRYSFLLGALLALLVIEPMASSLGIMESLFDALLTVVMAILAFGLAQDKTWRIIACVLCIPAAALSIGSHLMNASHQDLGVTIGHSMGAVFFVAVACKIVASIFTSQELTLDSIVGAICGYLLLGVAWALIYAMIHAANPESFRFSEPAGPRIDRAEVSRNVFIYYSFITLSTVGYGDVIPLSDGARTLAWVEAITGQLYLAVLIAGLVSAWVATRMAPSRPP